MTLCCCKYSVNDARPLRRELIRYEMCISVSLSCDSRLSILDIFMNHRTSAKMLVLRSYKLEKVVRGKFTVVHVTRLEMNHPETGGGEIS